MSSRSEDICKQLDALKFSDRKNDKSEEQLIDTFKDATSTMQSGLGLYGDADKEQEFYDHYMDEVEAEEERKAKEKEDWKKARAAKQSGKKYSDPSPCCTNPDRFNGHRLD